MLSVAPRVSAVTLAPLFQDNAVLQQGKPVPVWGSAAPGEKIVVEFAAQKKETTTAADGSWMVTLDALPVAKEGRDLTVTGQDTILRKGILVGEVWLCSGQSNMALLVKHAKDFPQERVTANLPLVREFAVENISQPKPALQVGGKWSICTPETVGDFSAVAYFYARRLFQELDVPIGIIRSSWGGTRIECWMNEATLASTPASAYYTRRWQKKQSAYQKDTADYDVQLSEWKIAEEKAQKDGTLIPPAPKHPQAPDEKFAPTGLFNGMISPLIPYSLAGIIWYQGEANASVPEGYSKLLTKMITQWRKDFAQPELPFTLVQLPNYGFPGDESGHKWALLREEQAKILAISNTSMIVTIDLGEADNVHPLNKQDVGLRLANNVLSSWYGRDTAPGGPVFLKEEPAGAAMKVTFTRSAGIYLSDPSAGSFELAGTDKVFHPAVAAMEGETVVVTSEKVSQPVAVRYAWKNNPQVILFGKGRLPAAPFRSDSW